MGQKAFGWEDPRLGCSCLDTSQSWVGGCDDPQTSGIPLPHFQAGTYKYFSGVAEPCQVAFASGSVSAGRGGGKGGENMLLEDALSPRRWGQQQQGPILEGLHLHLVSLYGSSRLQDWCRAVAQPVLSSWPGLTP